MGRMPPVTTVPETRYAKTDDGLAIAYQTLGDGPTDVVLGSAISCIDVMWDEPSFAHVLHRLAGFGRLICLDYRGFGASDPVPLGALPTPETRIEDTRVVLDAVGSATAHLVCHGASGILGMLFAATYPERTNTLTLLDASARTLRADDYPIGVPPAALDAFLEWDERVWGTAEQVQLWAPSRIGDMAFRRWWGRFERMSQSPSVHGAMTRWLVSLDLRAVLPSVRVPTLVMHHEENPFVRVGHGRYLADHIPGAKFVVVPGRDYWFFTEGADEIVDHIEELITGVLPVGQSNRALATVMFTDIVASTDIAARVGDKRWAQDTRRPRRGRGPRAPSLPGAQGEPDRRWRPRHLRRACPCHQMRASHLRSGTTARHRGSRRAPHRRSRTSGRRHQRHRGAHRPADLRPRRWW